MSIEFTPDQIAALSAKLSPANVKERKQAGRKLSYIEGWHAIAEANRIFGFGAWDRETLETRLVAEKPRKVGDAGRDGWGVSYIARVRVIVEGVIRDGVGAGHGIDVDLGLAHESAIKEAETDAMKRALMTFGNPFGLALYDKTQENVGDDRPPPSKERQGRPSAEIEDRTILETLITQMQSHADKASLRKWWATQRVEINNLSPDHRVEFDEAQARLVLDLPEQLNSKAA